MPLVTILTRNDGLKVRSQFVVAGQAYGFRKLRVKRTLFYPEE